MKRLQLCAGGEAVITPEILADVMNEQRPSVNAEQIRKFEEWARG